MNTLIGVFYRAKYMDEFEKSKQIVAEAMKNVLAEIVIVAEDRTEHIVYLTKFEMVNNKIEYDYSVFDESKPYKPELEKHLKIIFEKLYQDSIAKSKVFNRNGAKLFR